MAESKQRAVPIHLPQQESSVYVVSETDITGIPINLPSVTFHPIVIHWYEYSTLVYLESEFYLYWTLCQYDFKRADPSGIFTLHYRPMYLISC